MASHSDNTPAVLPVQPQGTQINQVESSGRDDQMQNPTADGGATQSSLTKPAPRKYKVNCWLRFCDTIERRTEAFLGEVAAFAARRSCMVIALCMSFVLLCGGGFAFFTVLWRTTLHPTCPAGL